ncbi:hypothetical protein TWF730_006984 [Orbilia blumenaviensis]|uniref:non-specific serine/threonine protein kinase n=1 Tax=Orbilia blumenaviensis TaxID=1796055 RepID=A0AAV9VH51_9PEZI
MFKNKNEIYNSSKDPSDQRLNPARPGVYSQNPPHENTNTSSSNSNSSNSVGNPILSKEENRVRKKARKQQEAIRETIYNLVVEQERLEPSRVYHGDNSQRMDYSNPSKAYGRRDDTYGTSSNSHVSGQSKYATPRSDRTKSSSHSRRDDEKSTNWDGVDVHRFRDHAAERYEATTSPRHGEPDYRPQRETRPAPYADSPEQYIKMSRAPASYDKKYGGYTAESTVSAAREANGYGQHRTSNGSPSVKTQSAYGGQQQVSTPSKVVYRITPDNQVYETSRNNTGSHAYPSSSTGHRRAEEQLTSRIDDISLKTPTRYSRDSETTGERAEYTEYVEADCPELERAQKRMIAPAYNDNKYEPATFVIGEDDYAVRNGGLPEPYELPRFDGYERELRVIKKHNAGCFGATAILEVLHDSPSGVTEGWYRNVKRGQRIIAKRISAVDPVRAKSWKIESQMLKFLGGVEANATTILKIIGRLAPAHGDPYGHIFTEFCNLGDVNEMLSKYMSQRPRTFIPEAFVWQMTIDIAKALLFLNRGIDSRKKEGRPGWVPIVHNDIKMNNIFMKSRPNGANNIYPLFVLGDFGLASYETDPAPPSCPIFMSPQRQPSFYEPTPSNHKDDIYSVGVSLFVLANGFFPFEKQRSSTQPLNFERRREHKNPFRKGFCQVINRCTSRSAETRPTARELIRLIIGLIEEKGWSREGSRERLWKVDWMDKSKAATWKDKHQKVEI